MCKTKKNNNNTTYSYFTLNYRHPFNRIKLAFFLYFWRRMCFYSECSESGMMGFFISSISGSLFEPQVKINPIYTVQYNNYYQ